MNIWLYILVGIFALIGVYTSLWGVIKGTRLAVGIARDLAQTLKDATEVAKAYREDLAWIRQFAQAATPLQGMTGGSEPPSILPKRQPEEPATFPAPYLGRFEQRPVEPDAPPEPIGDVDVTANDEEIDESSQPGLSVDEQERHKQQTREADAARIKELLNLGIPEKPEA